MDIPYLHTDIASEDFQILEDLATGSWYSEVLFAALELGVFDALSENPYSFEDLAIKLEYDPDSLSRFLEALRVLGLILASGGKYENGPLASRFLVRSSEWYAGHFLNYRHFLAPGWKRLPARIRAGVSANNRPEDETPEAYQERVFAYVRTMDFQARIKAEDAAQVLSLLSNTKPLYLLDIGGGAGAWCRALLGKWPEAHAVLLDLPEALAAARKLYPEASHWKGIEMVAGNGLTLGIGTRKFDLVILSNILHAYCKTEATQLLNEAVQALTPGGQVLIHDYLADGHRSSPLKGRLYDLHMLLNTYNGRIYSLEELQEMLAAAGVENSRLLHLETDTSILLASKDGSAKRLSLDEDDMAEAHARAAGFNYARVIEAHEIVTEPWVRIKCEQGCAHYGSSLSCPPHSLSLEKMREVLSAYTHALLVQSTPPAESFHERLLALERFSFLNGHPEALAFGTGPCPVCQDCSTDGKCRFPDRARPSLEACCVDVYETARRAGLSLAPLRHRMGYVKYVGLVLFRKR
jgi:predicted metal-binding protein/ubiquinone/menaquinone biosynthesis C-methylase UbiE